MLRTPDAFLVGVKGHPPSVFAIADHERPTSTIGRSRKAVDRVTAARRPLVASDTLYTLLPRFCRYTVGLQ